MSKWGKRYMSVMVKESLILEIRRTLDSLGCAQVYPELAFPSSDQFGDYTTNVAFMVAKTLKKTPQEIGELIKNSLSKSPYVSRIEVAGQGFINIWLSQTMLLSELQNVLVQKDQFGTSGTYAGKKVMIEFADPNPFKQFHIGHLRNICLGESLSRCFEAMGADVWRVNYQGDVGLHVAKCIYGMIMLKESMPDDSADLNTKIEFLSQAYANGAKVYEEKQEYKDAIAEINTKIYQKDQSVQALWEKGKKWSLDYFDTIYARVGTAYKRYYFESETEGPGKDLVMQHIQDGIFEQSDGAIIFRGEKYGLHTRVFVSSQGYGTYEAKDLGLAQLKYKDFPYDISIIQTGSEQATYFAVILKALSLIAPELGAKTAHFSFGMVSLNDRKMSSRTGEVVTAQWLLDEAKKKTRELFKDTDDQTAEKIGVAGVKYAMLSYSRESDIQFSFEQSVSLEGNSGPYLQYAFARTQSILEKSAEKSVVNVALNTIDSGGIEQIFADLASSELELNSEEQGLLKALHRFPGVVVETGVKFAPHILCAYLFDLGQKFNGFYQKYPIIDSDERDFRTALAAGVGHVLKNGLYLLGIEAPERI